MNVIVQRIAKDTRPTLGSTRAHVPLNNQLVPAESTALPLLQTSRGGKSSSFNAGNQRWFTINRFFGFLLLCDRLDRPQYGSGATTEENKCSWTKDHTHNAQRPMLNTTINWCCSTRLKAEYQWTPLQRVPSASHLLQSRSAPVVSSW